MNNIEESSEINRPTLIEICSVMIFTLVMLISLTLGAIRDDNYEELTIIETNNTAHSISGRFKGELQKTHTILTLEYGPIVIQRNRDLYLSFSKTRKLYLNKYRGFIGHKVICTENADTESNICQHVEGII